jgi:hypothetical protein
MSYDHAYFVTHYFITTLPTIEAVPLNLAFTGWDTGGGRARPVPWTGTSCGVSGASSANSTLADLSPVAVGTKMKVTLQVEDTASAPVQVFDVIVKSPGLRPVSVTLVKLAVEVPLFVTVTVAVLLVFPTIREPKSQLVFENEIPEAGATPVPATGILCGLVGSPSVQTRFAVLFPTALGKKLKVTLQY